jgi:hypothetical protein
VEAAAYSPEAKAASIVKELGPKKAQAFSKRTIAELSSDPRMTREADFWRNVNDILPGLTKRDVSQKFGHMYEVRINADPEKFLDWDKPLSQQGEAVKALFPNAAPTTEGKELLRMAQGLPARERPKPTGDKFNDWFASQWHDLGARDGVKKRASEQVLAEAGIPGIRYKDQGSRGTEGGTSNYVVFPGQDSIIEILRRYGLAGLMAGGAAASARPSQDTQ